MASPKTLSFDTTYTPQEDRFRRSPPSSRAAKRASSPLVEAYADIIARGGNIDAMLANRQQPGDIAGLHTSYDNPKNNRMVYYEEQVKYKGNTQPHRSARDSILKESSPVIAELKTNVIIKDEFTLVTDLSYQLATRYNRPDSSIMIKVDHSACLALGGTFDPCYILTVTAVPNQMTPKLNRRNATLLQSFMTEILSVPPDRGIIKFQPIEECNYAKNGALMTADIEEPEKKHIGTNSVVTPLTRSITTTSHKSLPSMRKSSQRFSDGMTTPNDTPINNKVVSPEETKHHAMPKTIVPRTVEPRTSQLFELPASNDDEVPVSVRRNPQTPANKPFLVTTQSDRRNSQTSESTPPPIQRSTSRPTLKTSNSERRISQIPENAPSPTMTKEDLMGGNDPKPAQSRPKSIQSPNGPVPVPTAYAPAADSPSIPTVSIQDDSAPFPSVFRHASQRSTTTNRPSTTASNATTNTTTTTTTRPPTSTKTSTTALPPPKPEPKTLASTLQLSSRHRSAHTHAKTTQSPHTTNSLLRGSAPQLTLLDPTSRLNAASTYPPNNQNHVHNNSTSQSQLNEKMRLVDAQTLYGRGGGDGKGGKGAKGPKAPSALATTLSVPLAKENVENSDPRGSEFSVKTGGGGGGLLGKRKSFLSALRRRTLNA